ncbi:hypothetical protein GBA63_15155 [Rubrobacter tropicus]|uniref:Uncharacterized protein n=1 Tax=Rubrobacter tropicus TaxID=2653851 RepID=A0A6G8QBF8_9ACTN|nr:hypothetical protein [Rubrobacter tropicus]QIN83825.1 hypothetical protein GBA63_15155 [Rubrobacter tropicus]
MKIYRSPGFEGSVCVVGGRPPTRLEDRLREVGVGSVFLFTGLGIPAKDLYEKNGYGGVTDMAAKVKVL